VSVSRASLTWTTRFLLPILDLLFQGIDVPAFPPVRVSFRSHSILLLFSSPTHIYNSSSSQFEKMSAGSTSNPAPPLSTKSSTNISSTPQCKVYKPPHTPLTLTTPSIFLAGSIEMGKATDWQTDFTNSVSHLPITIFNPRRDDWDSSWKQDISNPHFKEQVEWELDHLEKANLIVLYLQPGTMSPISLLELGLHAREGKVLVCCPEGFWRRGNVQVICERFKIPMFEDLEELMRVAAERILE
jgi:hypothetical protein